MNAAEQAKSVESASKIAAVVNLFKIAFPDARADLKPWHNDPDTRELVDPDSIDLGFHFPGRSRSLQSRSILVQIRLHEDSFDESSFEKNSFEKNRHSKPRRAIGIELAGFDHNGKQWRLSTIENWTFEGSSQPTDEMSEKLKQFLRAALELFNTDPIAN